MRPAHACVTRYHAFFCANQDVADFTCARGQRGEQCGCKMASGVRAACSEPPVCELCGDFDNLLLCSGCRGAWYCCKEHQKSHWRKHKRVCKTTAAGSSTGGGVSDVNIGSGSAAVGSSCCDCSTPTAAVVSAATANSVHGAAGAMTIAGSDTALVDKENHDATTTTTTTTTGCSISKNGVAVGDMVNNVNDRYDYDPTTTTTTSSYVNSSGCTPRTLQQQHQTGCGHNNVNVQQTHPDNNRLKTKSKSADRLATDPSSSEQSDSTKPSPPRQHDAETKLADYVVRCLNDFGICVIDHFMGAERGDKVFLDVKVLEDRGIFSTGQLVNVTGAQQKIRGDRITWVEKGDVGCDNIGTLMHRIDALLLNCNGHLARYNVNGRTKVGPAPSSTHNFSCEHSIEL